MAAGDPEAGYFIRSALKPFQALAAVVTGTLAHYELGDADLAIMCASHQGDVAQARQAFNVLWKCDLEPSVLQCPTPEHRRSPLEHNCSGKHAGMLAVCHHCGWTTHDYMNRRHPVQQLIGNQVAELLGMPAAELITARDDCGVPTYLMPLHQMAVLYAHLASSNSLELERISRAMLHHPELIAGEGQFDTELMKLTYAVASQDRSAPAASVQGALVSKAGAEGIQCIGRLGEGLGLAIKVQDGAKRAKYAVAIHLLRQLGWISPMLAEQLADGFLSLSATKRLEVTGELTLV